MTPERIDELIAMAALGELSPDDARALDEATRDDPALAAEVDDALASAGALQRVHAEVPPPGLRANVLAAVAATPQELGHDSAAPVVSMHAARSRRRRVLPLLLGAAAVLVFVVGAFLVSNEASAPDQFEAITEASDAQVHTVAGDLGTLTVVYSGSHDAMVVSGENISTLAGSATYQLWFEKDGQLVSAGLFRPDEDGHVEERIPVDDGTGDSINVTEEPAGGSAVPTPPVLATST